MHTLASFDFLDEFRYGLTFDMFFLLLHLGMKVLERPITSFFRLFSSFCTENLSCQQDSNSDLGVEGES